MSPGPEAWPHPAFTRFGVELEYMIVDQETLDVRPLAAEVLTGTGKRHKDWVRQGRLAWSNEIVSHVIELKTAEPEPDLGPLVEAFQRAVTEVEDRLRPFGARLLPTGAHPWMDPLRETVLWPHGYQEVYRAFDQIFDCRGHGWANVQSCHLNLPFGNAAEFRRLHTATRLVLPMIPALAASTPILDGQVTPWLSARLEAYRHNCRRLPSVTGEVIPELVNSPEEYQERVLNRIFADLAPLDPRGLLREPWVNARGATARFDRGSIEIRLLDLQECPAVDLALTEFVACVIESLFHERWATEAEQAADQATLVGLFVEGLTTGEQTPVPPTYRVAMGMGERVRTLRDVLTEWHARLAMPARPWSTYLRRVIDQGPLARRILSRTGAGPSRHRLHDVYLELAECLRANQPFA